MLGFFFKHQRYVGKRLYTRRRLVGRHPRCVAQRATHCCQIWSLVLPATARLLWQPPCFYFRKTMCLTLMMPSAHQYLHIPISAGVLPYASCLTTPAVLLTPSLVRLLWYHQQQCNTCVYTGRSAGLGRRTKLHREHLTVTPTPIMLLQEWLLIAQQATTFHNWYATAF